LFETPSIGESTEAREWWGCCNPFVLVSVMGLLYGIILPAIDVVHDVVGPSFAMCNFEILADPLNQVVLEGSLD
jgi:hypothetical protein